MSFYATVAFSEALSLLRAQGIRWPFRILDYFTGNCLAACSCALPMSKIVPVLAELLFQVVQLTANKKHINVTRDHKQSSACSREIWCEHRGDRPQLQMWKHSRKLFLFFITHSTSRILFRTVSCIAYIY